MKAMVLTSSSIEHTLRKTHNNPLLRTKVADRDFLVNREVEVDVLSILFIYLLMLVFLCTCAKCNLFSFMCTF